MMMRSGQRNGVTTARLKGMQQDLHISGGPTLLPSFKLHEIRNDLHAGI